jgi:RNA polymerase sigma-70 factor (ECF subfamily)
MHKSYVRPSSVAAVVPSIGATAGEYSSDKTLVERIAAGDKMRVLFARHRTNIYRWLLGFVGNENVAEDLLSDVFFDVWQQAGRFEGRSAVTTWLLSIARFKAAQLATRSWSATASD